MTYTQHFEQLLEPDSVRPLYRGPGGMHRTKQPSLSERMKQMQAAFPDYAEREKEWQEYLKTINR